MGREGSARLGALDGLRGLAALGIVVLRVLRDLPAALGFALIVGAVAGAPLRSRALVAAPVRTVGTLSYAIERPALRWARRLRGAELVEHPLRVGEHPLDRVALGVGQQ